MKMVEDKRGGCLGGFFKWIVIAIVIIVIIVAVAG